MPIKPLFARILITIAETIFILLRFDPPPSTNEINQTSTGRGANLRSPELRFMQTFARICIEAPELPVLFEVRGVSSPRRGSLRLGKFLDDFGVTFRRIST